MAFPLVRDTQMTPVTMINEPIIICFVSFSWKKKYDNRQFNGMLMHMQLDMIPKLIFALIA